MSLNSAELAGSSSSEGSSVIQTPQAPTSNSPGLSTGDHDNAENQSPSAASPSLDENNAGAGCNVTSPDPDLIQQNIQLKEEIAALKKQGDELKALSSRCDNLTLKFTTVESELNSLLKKTKVSEEDHQRSVSLLQERIDRLVAEKSVLMSDCQDLQDAKVALASEVETYRKLIEADEKRRNLSPNAAAAGDDSPVGCRCGTPLNVANKRRRFEEETTDPAVEFHTSTEIEISEGKGDEPCIIY